MTKKTPNPIDRHVGSRVRMRRMMISMSQEKLGERLGITFQQVQKYEKGTNRIGASRLHQIASILSVPVAFFYEDMPGAEAAAAGFGETANPVYISEFMASSEGLALAKAFMKVTDPKVRRRIVDLVEAMVAASQPAEK
jgi:transcriptional regulator with XRE-family HTH domain